MEHFNELSPAQAERLALLLEEMGEAQQVIGKILRHGYENYHPDSDPSETNRNSLNREMGDVLFVYEMMAGFGDIDKKEVETRTWEKSISIQKYLHHTKIA